MICDFKFYFFVIQKFKNHRLIDFLNFKVMGIWFSVGRNQAFDTEIAIVWLIAKIAAVSPKFIISKGIIIRMSGELQGRTVLFLCQALIDPFPDGSAGKARIGINYIPILLKVSARIAHYMRVLTHKYRFIFNLFP